VKPEKALNVFAGMVGDEIGASVRDLRDEIITAFRKRDEQLAELKGRIDMLASLLMKSSHGRRRRRIANGSAQATCVTMTSR
jgi:hypothetical protein